MQKGERFIRKIDATKKAIEEKYQIEFVRLYKRIGNDLINLLQRNQSINFNEVFQNYKGDYIYLYRNIFQDVKKQLGYEIREKLNFNLGLQVLLKSITIDITEQEKVNDIFDEKYTLLLNNETERLANDNFIQSEATYFSNLYNNAVDNFNKFIEAQKQQEQKFNFELVSLLLLNTQSQRDKQRIRYLQKQTEALKQNIQKFTEQKQKETLRQYKDILQEKIPVRSQDNAEYGTGQASSIIREVEYESIKESNATIKQPTTIPIATIITLASLVKKTWWERSQFIFGASPRINHLALSGTQANSQGDFNVSGYLVPRPRDYSLPVEESVRCRCEVEYEVD